MNDLILEQVTKGFGDHVVLREFSARFPGGQCTCIMGPSGCGKTTLLRLILGLEQPDSGRILGQTFPMAAVFQENRLFEDFSALSNVTAVCPRERRSEAAQHLIALGLGESLHAPVRTLSGGMKRRVAVARAVLAPGEILILDEPFTGLDRDTKAAVLEYLKAHTKGRTLLLVTHDPAERDALAQHVLNMAPVFCLSLTVFYQKARALTVSGETVRARAFLIAPNGSCLKVQDGDGSVFCLQKVGLVAIGDQGVFPQNPDQSPAAQGQCPGCFGKGVTLFACLLHCFGGQSFLGALQGQTAARKHDLLRMGQEIILSNQTDANVRHHQPIHLLHSLP